MKIGVLLAVLCRVIALEVMEPMYIVEDQLITRENIGADTIVTFASILPIYTKTFDYAVVRMEPLDGSDPDILIHNGDFPEKEEDAKFICKNMGGDICIVPKESITDPGMLAISVVCKEGCSFRLKVQLLAPTVLQQKKRLMKRMGEFSTEVYKFEIPSKYKTADITSFDLIVEAERYFTPMEVKFSLDPKLQIWASKDLVHMLDDGIGVHFSSKDQQWCAPCSVYIVLSVEQEGRYYLEGETLKKIPDLRANTQSELLVNPFQQECIGYYVQLVRNDLRLNFETLEGIADVYINPKNNPSSFFSSSVLIRGHQAASESFIFTQDDRTAINYRVGVYKVCFFAYTPLTVMVSAQESEMNNLFAVSNGQYLTKLLWEDEFFVVTFKDSHFNHPGRLLVEVDGQFSSANDGLSLQVLYRICKDGDTCEVTKEDIDQKRNGLADLPASSASQGEINGVLAHDPSVCPATCKYVFVVKNLESKKRTVSLRARAELENPGDVNLDTVYRNIVPKGQYFLYEINPTKAEATSFVTELTITLKSVTGDADLFVSYDTHFPTENDNLFRSRMGKGMTDQIKMRSTQDLLKKSLFISVFGADTSQYELSFNCTYLSKYDLQLDRALPTMEGGSPRVVISDEYEVQLYEYRQWWTASENRTTVFLADMLSGKLFFYAKFDSYPQHFLTTLHDFNETLAIYGSDPEYRIGGSFYIKLRPDFALYDVLAPKEYIFDWMTFSMPPPSATNISAGSEILNLDHYIYGLSNNSLYQDYVFHIGDTAAELKIILKRIPGHGFPKFYANAQDSERRIFPRKDEAQFTSVDSGPESVPESQQTLSITQYDREEQWPPCRDSHLTYQPGLTQKCLIAIGVTCSDGKQCAYKLKVTQNGLRGNIDHNVNAGDTFIPEPPMPIIPHRFNNGKVAFDKVNYYVFPINPEEPEILVFLNKTAMGSGKNGDSKMLALLQKTPSSSSSPEPSEQEIAAEGDEQTKWSFADWVYPTNQYFGAASQSNDNRAPEMVLPCPGEIKRACEGGQDCALIIGVAGITPGKTSTYRVSGLYGQNKLREGIPQTHAAGTFNFWFLINDTVIDHAASFDYIVSASGAKTKMYASLMDGRVPSRNDFDLKSEMNGANSIRVSSRDPIWRQMNWKTTNGVIVILTVEAESQFQMLLRRASAFPEEATVLKANSGHKIKNPEIDKPYYFSFFSFGNQDFRIDINSAGGTSVVYVSKYSQFFAGTDAFSALPQSGSYLWMREIEGKDSFEIQDDTCFNCLYFIRVEALEEGVQELSTSIYFIFKLNSGFYKDLAVGYTMQGRIEGDEVERRSFKLISKESFAIETTASLGSFLVIVRASPNSNEALWEDVASSGSSKIEVKTIDPNFHVGQTYFMDVKAIGGQPTIFSLTISQGIEADFLPKSNSYLLGLSSPQEETRFSKYVFPTAEQEVKFQVVMGPRAFNSGDALSHVSFRLTIEIRAITEGFYPVLFLKKQGSSTSVDDIAKFQLPTPEDYDEAFGLTPYSLLGQQSFTFSFLDQTTEKYTYYTMALFNFNWGLSSATKQQYELRTRIDKVRECEVDGSCSPVVQAAQNEVSFLQM